MKIKLVGGMAMVLLTNVAFAGEVANKKAIRGAEQAIQEASTKTMAACGNTLEVAVSWDNFRALIEKDSAVLEEKGTKPEWVFTEAGNRTAATLGALEKICNDDADYKAEIALLTSIAVEPSETYADYKSKFSLSETTLTVQSGFYMTREAADFVKPLKAMY